MSKLIHDSSANIERVANAIMAYVNTHVDAADSVAGICDWWLQDVHNASLCEATVESALERLVRRGRLRAERGADGTVLYCAAHTRETLLRLVS